MYLVFSKKLYDIFWKLLGWIVYISLLTISVWFTWEVFEKFAKQETAIQQYEEKIAAHPTIAICNFHPSWEYQKKFTINYTTYQSDGYSIEDEVALKIGENDLENSERIVNLTIIYTYHNGLCFTINTNRNVDEREAEIKIWFSGVNLESWIPKHLFVIFTSEENSYGNTRKDWRDGKAYSFYISSGNRKDLTLTVEKNINLKCNEESFYTYVASQLSEQSFKKCNDTCLRTSLPNDPYPICPNFTQWYNTKTNYLLDLGIEDCNWSMVKSLIQNITSKDEHQKTCTTTQYSGLSQQSSDQDTKIKYKFALPLKAKVYEEYFIIDSIGLIASVGGTLGVFIGFSFSNLIISIIEYIRTLMERKLTHEENFTQTIWNCFEWIIYFFLLAIAILFARESIGKFFDQITGIKQNMEKIEKHPTIMICPFLQSPYEECEWPIHNYIGDGYCDDESNNEVCEWDGGDCCGDDANKDYCEDCKCLSSLSMEDSYNYGTEFNITYQTYNSNGEISLKMGENYLLTNKEKVSLKKIYTRWNSICYKINTTRKADSTITKIKLKTSSSKIPKDTEFFFTSEENSFGITNNDFRDGKTFSTQIKGQKWKVIDLSVEKNINWNCGKKSFFEYISSRLSDRNFKNCNSTCLRTSLPDTFYPICPNYEDWYDNVLQGNLTEPKDDCNWGIVRDLIKEIIIKDEHLKNCVTIDYFGKIMAEKKDLEYNELGIQYKFVFPLRSKVYQEFLITDTIELVGSVGGTLGLFIGFSFSNIITFIFGYIEAFFSSRKKLFEATLVSVGWIFYLCLMATSIWFAWGVLDKFFKQDTGIAIQQHDAKSEIQPTVVICMGSSKYQTDFTIAYGVISEDGSSLDDEAFDYLVIGENHLESLKETVNLTIVYTRYYGMCYAIKTSRKVDERKTNIKIYPTNPNYYFFTIPKDISVIFTSDMNSYGVTQRDWRDGEEFSFITSIGNSKSIDLTVEKNINLKCKDESFYEYVATRLTKDNFEKCNDTCLMTSLPNDPYPICPNYNEWYKDTKGKESNCNWYILRDLVQNISINEEHLKTCVTTQYLGRIEYDSNMNYGFATILYKFALPLKTKVYEEYLITDGITLIGSVGGTLGLFIGFSISNVVYSILDFLKATTGNHPSRYLSKKI